jgi:hypothetical protein
VPNEPVPNGGFDRDQIAPPNLSTEDCPKYHNMLIAPFEAAIFGDGVGLAKLISSSDPQSTVNTVRALESSESAAVIYATAQEQTFALGSRSEDGVLRQVARFRNFLELFSEKLASKKDIGEFLLGRATYFFSANPKCKDAGYTAVQNFLAIIPDAPNSPPPSPPISDPNIPDCQPPPPPGKSPNNPVPYPWSPSQPQPPSPSPGLPQIPGPLPPGLPPAPPESICRCYFEQKKGEPTNFPWEPCPGTPGKIEEKECKPPIPPQQKFRCESGKPDMTGLEHYKCNSAPNCERIKVPIPPNDYYLKYACSDHFAMKKECPAFVKTRIRVDDGPKTCGKCREKDGRIKCLEGYYDEGTPVYVTVPCNKIPYIVPGQEGQDGFFSDQRFCAAPPPPNDLDDDGYKNCNGTCIYVTSSAADNCTKTFHTAECADSKKYEDEKKKRRSGGGVG